MPNSCDPLTREKKPTLNLSSPRKMPVSTEQMRVQLVLQMGRSEKSSEGKKA